MKGYRLKPGHAPREIKIDKISLTESYVQDVLRLPPTKQIWQASRRDSGLRVHCVAAEVCLVVEAGSSEVRAAEPVAGNLNPVALLEAIFYGMNRPQSGSSYRPAEVHLDDLEAAELFGSLLAPLGIEVRYRGTLTDLDAAWNRLQFQKQERDYPN